MVSHCNSNLFFVNNFSNLLYTFPNFVKHLLTTSLFIAATVVIVIQTQKFFFVIVTIFRLYYTQVYTVPIFKNLTKHKINTLTHNILLHYTVPTVEEIPTFSIPFFSFCCSAVRHKYIFEHIQHDLNVLNNTQKGTHDKYYLLRNFFLNCK